MTPATAAPGRIARELDHSRANPMPTVPQLIAEGHRHRPGNVKEPLLVVLQQQEEGENLVITRDHFPAIPSVMTTTAGTGNVFVVVEGLDHVRAVPGGVVAPAVEPVYDWFSMEAVTATERSDYFDVVAPTERQALVFGQMQPQEFPCSAVGCVTLRRSCDLCGGWSNSDDDRLTTTEAPEECSHPPAMTGVMVMSSASGSKAAVGMPSAKPR